MSAEELPALTAELLALRRVATMAAGGAGPEEVFTAVAEGIGQLLRVEYASMSRYGRDRTVSLVAVWGTAGANVSSGLTRVPLGGNNLSTLVYETGRPARVDDYADASGPTGVALREIGVRSAVGTPIIVKGRLWGVMAAAASGEKRLPAGTEERLALFTDLLATAVASAESQAGLARLAEEQAALRRVATVVAGGAAPEDVFAAVVAEVEQLLPVEYVHMGRYDANGSFTIVASSGRAGPVFPVGARLMLEGKNLGSVVAQTRRAALIESWADASGPIAATLRERGVRWSVGTPIIVEGHLWGMIAAGSIGQQRPLADTEARLAEFTDLLATAIANAESRASLAASRAQIVAAADSARRRIERDLHDGAQQRLVNAVIVLKLALQALKNDDANVGELATEALRQAEQANCELRELAHGTLPAALTSDGLKAGVEAIVSPVSLPISVEISVGRLPADVEATAYFVISEALTNVVKHARAERATVTARAEHGTLRVEIRDDGIGGVDPARGSGLVGIGDRIEELGGTLELISPAGDGTTLVIEIPLERHTSAGLPRP